MRKGPKIKIEIRPLADNEIQFHDALMGAADQIKEIASIALNSGDAEQFKGTHHVVHSANDDADDIGDIYIGD